MPPQLALFLCTVFVLFLLRLERNIAPNVSHVLWIPTIWMFLAISKPLALWFGGDMLASSTESGSQLDRIALILLLCTGLFVLIGRKFDWGKAVRDNVWLMLLLGFMLVSIFWSDVPFVSFKRWVRELVALIMVFVIATEHSPYHAFECILRRSAYILIPFSILLIKYYTEYGVLYTRWDGALMWIGVTTHKNALGLLCLIVIFFLSKSLIERRKNRGFSPNKFHTLADVSILIMAIILLIGPEEGSYSATSIGALAVGFLSFYVFSRRRQRKKKIGTSKLIVLLIFIIGTGILTPIVGGSNLAGVTSFFGRDATFTGRAQIWDKLSSYTEKRPILGYGFGGFWTSETIEEIEVSEAHNGYLEVRLELGYVGLLFLVIFLLSLAIRINRKMADELEWSSFCLSLLVMFLFHNFTEATINSFARSSTAVILIMAVCSNLSNSHTPKVVD